METYQFFFPNEGVDLSTGDQDVLEYTLSSRTDMLVKYVWVRSYTDKTGTSECNTKIASARADAVSKVILDHERRPDTICSEIVADQWSDEEEKQRTNSNNTSSNRRVEDYVYFGYANGD